jgi:hypothetical protein
MSEETKEAGEAVVTLTEEERLKRRYDKVNADFEEWERNHPGYNVLNPEYIQLNQLLNDAERRWKDARAAAENVVPAARGVVGGSLTYADGINPNSPHFNRDEIMTKMFNWITGEKGKNRFLLLNSPAASGKTSLLILFQHKYPSLNAIYISLKEDSNPYNSLVTFGLDIKKRACTYPQVIYMLDDAQHRYDQPSFWDVLFKDVPLYFEAGVRFIISATHLISTRDQSSPVHFRELETISRNELLLSDEQSLALLNSRPPLGLQSYMRNYSQLKTHIVEHCNGLIGALCRSVHFYADEFHHDVSTPTEVECLRAFYSKRLLDRMDRCFGTVDPSRLSLEAYDALLQCVLGARIRSIVTTDQSLSDICASFAKAGILKVDEQRYYIFSSILAKRYFTHRYFPDRADAESDTLTLYELVTNAIRSMSAIALMKSTSNTDDFPKETTFQHFFALGLLRNTTADTAICSELSRSFATNTNVTGEIDFFVNGDRMWGIELVRCGDKIGEHISRFSPQGKYAGLQSKDYVVLDFRKGITNVSLDPHRVTASFPLVAGRTCFENVVVKYGNDEPITLHLQP